MVELKSHRIGWYYAPVLTQIGRDLMFRIFLLDLKNSLKIRTSSSIIFERDVDQPIPLQQHEGRSTRYFKIRNRFIAINPFLTLKHLSK